MSDIADEYRLISLIERMAEELRACVDDYETLWVKLGDMQRELNEARAELVDSQARFDAINSSDVSRLVMTFHGTYPAGAVIGMQRQWQRFGLSAQLGGVYLGDSFNPFVGLGVAIPLGGD